MPPLVFGAPFLNYITISDATTLESGMGHVPHVSDPVFPPVKIPCLFRGAYQKNIRYIGSCPPLKG